MGKGSKEINRFFINFLFYFIMVMKCLNLQDHQAKTHNYRKELAYLKNRATTNQNQTLHSQKLKRKVLKHKINGNHPTKKRKKEKRSIESTGKQGLKWH